MMLLHDFFEIEFSYEMVQIPSVFVYFICLEWEKKHFLWGEFHMSKNLIHTEKY